jgi:hypothetical protein
LKEIRWNELKNKRLKKVRGVSFEVLLQSRFLTEKEHPCRPNQWVWVFEYRGEAWVVPFVRDESGVFLKTLFPSRKYRKIYLKERDYEKD